MTEPSFDPPRLAVFCGARTGSKSEYSEGARALGRCLVARGLGLVYGGGSVGLMGVIADEVLAGGGEVIGVIPERLARPEIAHDGLSQLHVVDGMHPRKALMAELSAGFIAMPGGMGTLEELFEALTWTQLRIHDKPVGLLNTAGYWTPLLELMDASVSEGFIDAAHRPLLLSEETPGDLIDRLVAWRPGDTPSS